MTAWSSSDRHQSFLVASRGAGSTRLIQTLRLRWHGNCSDAAMLSGWFGFGGNSGGERSVTPDRGVAVPAPQLVTVLTLIAAALLISIAQGCSQTSCTLVGWSEGLTVKLTSAQPLTAGTYHFSIEIPDETFELDLKLEAPNNTEGGVYVSEHMTRGHWQLNASLTGSEAFGTSGDISVGRFKGQTGGPESLILTVRQDGTEIGRLELDEIAYRQDEPNGPGCGVATTASASLELAPLQ